MDQLLKRPSASGEWASFFAAARPARSRGVRYHVLARRPIAPVHGLPTRDPPPPS
ncbi:hypothetical protein KTE69_14320 [Burkholderia multivorans]|uniref:hypothetical protein n=1 Tax=Burkholderia multivorans TaxID=87883 RepID=UPI000309D503|nr:hypothetical protein [Burkholderia multivorans]MBU9369541.1 hypothetical protein [Burkholderia multivorans]UQO44151.1 hypothetical protein L0Z43_25930 [Burkholderia multivorans]